MITKQDLERLQELLSCTFNREDGREFKTDEIRFLLNDGVHLWDSERKDWYYLTEDMQWTADYEHENLLTLK